MDKRRSGTGSGGLNGLHAGRQLAFRLSVLICLESVGDMLKRDSLSLSLANGYKVAERHSRSFSHQEKKERVTQREAERKREKIEAEEERRHAS